MPVHFITLRSLSKELHDSLQGATIIEVFSQQKNELCVTCLKETTESTLCISVESKMNYCVLRTEFSRARKNSVDLFPTLAGKTIKQISLHSTDRIIIIEVESGVRLYLRLYNSAASNIVLIDSEHGVAESFKHDKELLGKQLTISSRGDWELLKDVQRFSEAMKQHDEKSVEESLRKAIPMFGALYSREILFRSGVDATRIVQSLNDGEMQTLFDAVTNILLEFDDAHPIIYYEEEKPSILSMIQLRHCNEMSAKQFGSVNEAVRLMIGQSFRTKSFSEKKNELLDGVRRVLAQTERNLKAIEKELASSERAQEYERIGHSIMANLHNITKGMKQIVLPDVFDGQKQLSIQLEPSLTPYQNAEKYFEKARKAKLSRSESEERLQSQQEQIKQLQQLIDELSACSTSDELKDFSSRNRERLLFIKTEKTE
ncbi:MAG: NFACT family protein, partial [Ignavibacteriales bacterium]|nr:NFACT family protein [Ignavibacteriales bacterium]